MEMTKAQKREYIHNLARTVASRWKIHHAASAHVSDKDLPCHLYRNYGNGVNLLLKQDYNEDTVAKIARCGVGDSVATDTETSLRDVHNVVWYYADQGGDTMIRDLAVMAIIAAMADNIKADRKRSIEACLGTESLGETLGREIARSLRDGEPAEEVRRRHVNPNRTYED